MLSHVIFLVFLCGSISKAAVYVGSATNLGSENIDFSVEIDTTADTVDITLVGPSSFVYIILLILALNIYIYI